MEDFDTLTFIDQEGKIKTKEIFLQEASNLYDNFQQMATEENQEYCNPDEILDYFNYSERNIFITQEVTDKTSSTIFKQVKYYNKLDDEKNIPPQNRKPIKIFIDTDGGDLNAAFSIISTIETSTTPIYTYNIGKAWSAGFFILVAGHKRYGMPYSSYLFHNGSCSNEADAHNFINYSNFYSMQLKQLRTIILTNTNLTAELYDQHYASDWWFDNTDALSNHIIDEIAKI